MTLLTSDCGLTEENVSAPESYSFLYQETRDEAFQRRIFAHARLGDWTLLAGNNLLCLGNRAEVDQPPQLLARRGQLNRLSLGLWTPRLCAIIEQCRRNRLLFGHLTKCKKWLLR